MDKRLSKGKFGSCYFGFRHFELSNPCSRCANMEALGGFDHLLLDDFDERDERLWQPNDPLLELGRAFRAVATNDNALLLIGAAVGWVPQLLSSVRDYAVKYSHNTPGERLEDLNPLGTIPPADQIEDPDLPGISRAALTALREGRTDNHQLRELVLLDHPRSDNRVTRSHLSTVCADNYVARFGVPRFSKENEAHVRAEAVTFITTNCKHFRPGNTKEFVAAVLAKVFQPSAADQALVDTFSTKHWRIKRVWRWLTNAYGARDRWWYWSLAPDA